MTLGSVGDAVIATDSRGAITLMNAIAESLTGWRAADAIGRPMADVFRIVNEETRHPVDDPTERVLREGTISGLANHTVLIARDGREVPIDDSAAPITDASGRLSGAVLVFRDITARRAVERERAAALAQERAARTEAERLARRLRDLQSVTDTTLSRRPLPELLKELLGRVRTALASDTATVLLLDEDETHLTPVSSDGLREGVSERVRIPLGRGVAGRIALTVSGMIVDDLGAMEVVSEFLSDRVKSLVGVPLRVGERLLGVLHVGAAQPRRFSEADLDLLRLVGDRAGLAIARARADESERQGRIAVEAAERRVSFLAEASRVLASSLDLDETLDRLARVAVPEICDLCVINTLAPDGTIRRPAAAFVDATREPLVRDLQRRFPIDPRGSHPVARVLRTGRPEVVTEISDDVLATIATDPEHLRIARALGYASYVVVPLVARGRTLGTISLVSGPSGRRYRSDDLSLAEDLGRRAALAVDNARLYRQAETARAAAESANRMKDDFLAMLSHELRTPLTSIVGWARMLAATSDDAIRLRGLGVIERSASLQTRLIEDLLDIARFMRGEGQLHTRDLDPTHVVEAAIEAARPAAEAKGVVVEARIQSPVGRLVADADRLQQVVANLLGNAIKFTPAGGRITVGLARVERAVCLTVSDTGRGISQAVIPHVFEAFRRGDSSEPGGLGLGLAIVRQVVELHGGTVTAESAGEGRGATFTVTLPSTGPTVQ